MLLSQESIIDKHFKVMAILATHGNHKKQNKGAPPNSSSYTGQSSNYSNYSGHNYGWGYNSKGWGGFSNSNGGHRLNLTGAGYSQGDNLRAWIDHSVNCVVRMATWSWPLASFWWEFYKTSLFSLHL